MKKVTLGGDRLSSGKKMTVNLKAYERSSHNRGYMWRSTMSPGTVVPFLVQVGTPGTTFDIDLDIDIMTHPTLGPLFGSFKIDAHIFQLPIRLYHAWLHNNKLKIGLTMQAVKLPTLTLTAQSDLEISDSDINTKQINPSCLLAYLGIRGIGWAGEVSQERDFNAVSLIGYWDIIKNYYTNKQEEIGAYIHGDNEPLNETIDTITIGGTNIDEEPTTGAKFLVLGQSVLINFTGAAPLLNTIYVRIVGIGGDRRIPIQLISNDLALIDADTYSGTITGYALNEYVVNWGYRGTAETPIAPPLVKTFNLNQLDDLREAILAHPGPDPFNLNDYGDLPAPMLDLLTVSINDQNPRLNTQEGLAVKTYLSDLYNNWLNTEWIEDINEASRVSTLGDFFTMDALNLAKKKYELLNRIGVSGGTYKDWMETTYTHINFNQLESPIYHGGLIKELVFQEIVSNAESTPQEGGKAQPLGTLAGKGVMTKKHKGGKIVAKVEEMSYMMGLISITPRIDYSQGNAWDVHLQTMDDFHKPVFDEIGFQELTTEQMAWWDTQWIDTDWVVRSAGKQPAWINYMTETNKLFGNFAIENSEMFMTLNRRYERNVSTGRILDLTTYIDPVKYNFIFADTSIDAMNFWVNIAVDMTVRAKMSGKLMPNL